MPKELIHQLETSGFTLTQAFPGVYYIEGKGFFPTQLIITSELGTEEHAVLRILSRNAREDDIRVFLKRTAEIVEQGDAARADAILQVSATANFALYRKIYEEEPNMCQALYEIMKDDIERRVQQGVQQGMQQGLQQGMQQGAKQNAAEVYARLRAANMPEEQAYYMAYGTTLSGQNGAQTVGNRPQ